MMAQLASLKAILDKYEPRSIEDASKAFTEVFEAFDPLICDDSYYSQVMRKLSALLKAGIYYNKTVDTKILQLVHQVNNQNFKAIFFSNFGRKEQPTLYGSLCSVLETYKKDTDYLEALLIEQQDETKRRREI